MDGRRRAINVLKDMSARNTMKSRRQWMGVDWYKTYWLLGMLKIECGRVDVWTKMYRMQIGTLCQSLWMQRST